MTKTTARSPRWRQRCSAIVLALGLAVTAGVSGTSPAAAQSDGVQNGLQDMLRQFTDPQGRQREQQREERLREREREQTWRERQREQQWRDRERDQALRERERDIERREQRALERRERRAPQYGLVPRSSRFDD